MIEKTSLMKSFITIWTRPKQSIRKIVDLNPTYGIYLLSCIYGICYTFNKFEKKSYGDQHSFWLLIVGAILIGMFTGILNIYLRGWLIGKTGKLLGGVGSVEAIRAAVSWGRIAYIPTLFFWIINFCLLGEDSFKSVIPILETNGLVALGLLLIMSVNNILLLWGRIISIFCIAEVQGFSFWKALLNDIIATLVIVIPILFIMLVMFI